MNITELLKNTAKPELYTEGTGKMWTDEYISKQLLAVHLNAEIDLASRKRATIQKTLDWILSKTEEEPMEMLDLGCGPGLYTELLATKGHQVTGVDISKESINFAQNSAREKGLVIDYQNQNYLELDLGAKQFDLVIMIFTDFGVLLPHQRSKLLASIRSLLKPGGIFIFDALNDKNLAAKVAPKSWDCNENGFWRKEPYLALSNSYFYEDEKVILYQHIIVDKQQKVETYRFWTHFFSHDNLEEILKKEGFKDLVFYEDVLPEGDMWNGDNVTFCRAKLQK